MIFSSLTFLLVFLPLLIITYFIIPARFNSARKYVLLLFSFLFYASGEPIYVLLILGCVSMTWILSKGVSEGNKTILTISLIINLLPLIVLST